MSKTKILITRHGVTSWNKEGRMQGQTDVPLHEDAHEQVKNLAKKIRNHLPISTIYTSHLIRTIQTGQILQDTLNIKNILHLEDLAERYYGPYEGRLFHEVVAELETAGKNFFTDEVDAIEPPEQFKKRIIDSFDFIVQKHPDETILVVTHGGGILQFLAHHNMHFDIRHIPNDSLFLYLPHEPSVTQLF